MQDMNYPAEDYREELYSYISDASKDVNGFRMRYDISQYSTNELLELCDYWDAELRGACIRKKMETERYISQFEALIESTIAIGAKCRETAIRWIWDGEMDPEYEAMESVMSREYFCHKMGLPYSYAHNGTIYATV